jgi:hypothetical protein
MEDVAEQLFSPRLPYYVKWQPFHTVDKTLDLILAWIPISAAPVFIRWHREMWVEYWNHYPVDSANFSHWALPPKGPEKG